MLTSQKKKITEQINKKKNLLNIFLEPCCYTLLLRITKHNIRIHRYLLVSFHFII